MKVCQLLAVGHLLDMAQTVAEVLSPNKNNKLQDMHCSQKVIFQILGFHKEYR